jgi:uncharacterized membrane protein
MAKEFFSDDEKKAIVTAIHDAEKDTSGEIKVHIESTCGGPVLDRATKVFALLEMHRTKERNGVLIYLALKDKKFAILGDQGINTRVPENFWNEIKDEMQTNFRAGKFTDGLCKGIRRAGIQLKQHFPCRPDDVNELPNDISFGAH